MIDNSDNGIQKPTEPNDIAVNNLNHGIIFPEENNFARYSVIFVVCSLVIQYCDITFRDWHLQGIMITWWQKWYWYFAFKSKSIIYSMHQCITFRDWYLCYSYLCCCNHKVLFLFRYLLPRRKLRPRKQINSNSI